MVRSLAWKILYANHRPSLGPDRWGELVARHGGPSDVKQLSLDDQVPLGPFLGVVEELASRIADEPEKGRRRIGRGLVDRWASMYQRLVEHLEARPVRTLEVATKEVIPWFFEDSSLTIARSGKEQATLELDPDLPAGFQAGIIEGFLAQVGVSASLVLDEDHLQVTWTSPAPERPHPMVVLAEATRARFLTATLVPILVGTALAFVDGTISGVRAGAALVAAAFLHLSANLLNDVFDHRRGVDEANLTPTPFSGGSRVIQRGLLGSRRVLALAITLGLVGAGTGGWLALQAGVEVLALGLLGIGLGYAYSADPLRLSHRGMGELVAGLVFGPLIAAGAYAVQRPLTGEALLVGIPVGLLMAGLLAVNEMPDARWDARTGKRTLVVRVGDRAPEAIGLLFTAGYASVIGLVIADIIAWPALGSLATLPLALHVVRGLHNAGDQPEQLVPFLAAAFWLHASTGLIVAAGIAAGGGI